MKPHSRLILCRRGVFSFTKVCIFLPIAMVFIMFFITTVCFYDFCKTVLVKKYTPCQGIIWFSLTNSISFTLAFMWSQWLCTPPKTIVSSTEKNSIRRMQIHTFRTESSEGMVTMHTIYFYLFIFFIMLIEKIICVHSAHHNIYRDIVLFSRSWMNCREKLAKKVEQWTDAPNVVGGKKMLPMDYPNFREKYVQPLTL